MFSISGQQIMNKPQTSKRVLRKPRSAPDVVVLRLHFDTQAAFAQRLSRALIESCHHCKVHEETPKVPNIATHSFIHLLLLLESLPVPTLPYHSRHCCNLKLSFLPSSVFIIALCSRVSNRTYFVLGLDDFLRTSWSRRREEEMEKTYFHGDYAKAPPLDQTNQNKISDTSFWLLQDGRLNRVSFPSLLFFDRRDHFLFSVVGDGSESEKRRLWLLTCLVRSNNTLAMHTIFLEF